MSPGDTLDQATMDIVADGTSKEGLAAELIERAIERHLRERSGDRGLWFLSHPALLSHPRLTESVLARLLDASASLLSDLGHRSEPRQLIELLADEHKYPEAVLTIAKYLYTESGASIDEFQRFLEQHADNAWMLKSLVHLSVSRGEKDEALSKVLKRHSDLYSYYIEVRRSQQRQARAATETSAEGIQELFETRDPAVLCSLATNPNTPEPVLEQLTQIKEIKRSREIRQLAKDALRRKSKARNE
jgi:F0F1-type ATP synthase delta subunit